MRNPYAVFSFEEKTLTFFYKEIDPQKSWNIWIEDEQSIGFLINPKRNGNPDWTIDNINDKIETVIFDKTFKNFKPNFTSYWFSGLKNLKTIKNLDFLDTSNVEDMRFMFSDCNSLEEIDLSHFDTSKVKNFSYMFDHDYLLETLDLSSFSNESVVWEDKPHEEFDNGYASMFWGCSNLETIYASNKWDENQSVLPLSGWLFADCPSLIGGEGSKPFDPEYDGPYARIDNGPQKPGYFTLREK